MTDPIRVTRGGPHGGTSIIGATRVCSQVSTNAIATTTTSSSSVKYAFAPISPSKLASRSAAGSTPKTRKPPLPAKLHGRGLVSYAKPRRTVQLLEGTPCYLPSCPTWIKSPSLWAPRFSSRQVDVKTLGFGRHGSQVLLVRQLAKGGTAVMKQFVREKLVATPRLHDKVLNEWHVHSALVPHPNIVPLYGAVEDKSYVTLVLEAQRGDVLWYLDQTDRETLSEDEARNVAADVLSALAYMHDMGFVHRDVKAENVFAAPRTPAGLRYGSTAGGDGAAAADPVGFWRLGDLGSAVELAEVMRPGAPGLHLEGSPPFLAPEYAALWVAPPASRSAQQLQRATSPKQDIWAVGALVYDILIGHPPFSGPDPEAEPPLPQLATAILSQPPSPTPDAAAAAGTISAAAAAFLNVALRKAPEERPTAAELLSHPWLTEAPAAAAPPPPPPAAAAAAATAAIAPTGSAHTVSRRTDGAAPGEAARVSGGTREALVTLSTTSAASSPSPSAATLTLTAAEDPSPSSGRPPSGAPASPSGVAEGAAAEVTKTAAVAVAVAAHSDAAWTGPAVSSAEVADPWVRGGAASGAEVGEGPGTAMSRGAGAPAEMQAGTAGRDGRDSGGGSGESVIRQAVASTPSNPSTPRAAEAAAVGAEQPEAVAAAAAAAVAAELAVAAAAEAAEASRMCRTVAPVTAASRKGRTVATSRAVDRSEMDSGGPPPPPPSPPPSSAPATSRAKQRSVKPAATRRKAVAAAAAAAPAGEGARASPSTPPSQLPPEPLCLQPGPASELEVGLELGLALGLGLDARPAEAEAPAAAAADPGAASDTAVGPAGEGAGGGALAQPATTAVSEPRLVKRQGTTRRRQQQQQAPAPVATRSSKRVRKAAAVTSVAAAAAAPVGATADVVDSAPATVAAASSAITQAGQALAGGTVAATTAAAAALSMAGSGRVAAAANEDVAEGAIGIETGSPSVSEDEGPEEAAAAAAAGLKPGRPRTRARSATAASRRRGAGSARGAGSKSAAVTAVTVSAAAMAEAAEVTRQQE